MRDIEVFLTLAEELHFGRTAEKLHLTQARVSQVIKKLERRIGTSLFDRTSRYVALTPIGARLRDDLRAGYQLIRDGVAAATEAATGLGGHLTLGLMANHAVQMPDVLELFRHRHPHCDLRVREITFNDPFGALRAGKVDLGVVWLPVHEPDLTTGPVLFTESRVLAVASGDPLAARPEVRLEDLADRTTPAPEAAVPDYWWEARTPRHTPSGRPIHRGPHVATLEEALAEVAAGTVVATFGIHVALTYQRPGVSFVTLTDAPRLRFALIWRTAAETGLVRAFAQTARVVGTRHITGP